MNRLSLRHEIIGRTIDTKDRIVDRIEYVDDAKQLNRSIERLVIRQPFDIVGASATKTWLATATSGHFQGNAWHLATRVESKLPDLKSQVRIRTFNQ